MKRRISKPSSFNLSEKDSTPLNNMQSEIVQQTLGDENFNLMYGAIIENMSEGVIMIRANDGVIIFSNAAFEQMLGYKSGELLGRHVSVVNAPSDKTLEEIASLIISEVKKNDLWRVEIQNIKKDGTLCWGLANVASFLHPQFGEVLISTQHDISERKKTEEELKNKSRKLELAMQTANMAWWEMDISTGLVLFDIRKTEMLGFNAKDFKHYKDFTALVHPEDYDQVMKAMTDHLKGEKDKYETEYRIKTSSGEYVWFYDIGAIVDRDSNGNALSVAGLVKDINDSKITEKALEESEFNYKNFVQHSPNIIYKFSNKRGGLFWSERVLDILGFSPDDIQNNPFLWSNSIHPDDKADVQKAIDQNERGQKYNIDYRIQAKDGRWIWLNDCFTHKSLVGDEIIFEGTATDITNRKKMEDSLRILSRAVDQSPVSIVITDINGTIEYVNPKFSQLTGYSLIEAYKKNPRILKTGYTNKEEYEIMWKTIRSGNEWEGEFCNKKKNGELYWESAVISPIINDEGEITHFVAVKEDITKQKETERRIQASIIEAEERERLHFSQELHDGIGPLLSATKMYVQWLGMPNAKIETSEIIKDIEKFLDESARTIHDLSFKLSPHILQNFGLIDAIKSYTHKVNESSSIAIKLNSGDIPRFDLNSETIAYRVLCECINNTIKHAKATKINIDFQCKNDLLTVKCNDNGIGFESDIKNSEIKGIGHLNMQNRVKSVNGKLTIVSAPGKGTTVKFQIKMFNN